MKTVSVITGLFIVGFSISALLFMVVWNLLVRTLWRDAPVADFWLGLGLAVAFWLMGSLIKSGSKA